MKDLLYVVTNSFAIYPGFMLIYFFIKSKTMKNAMEYVVEQFNNKLATSLFIQLLNYLFFANFFLHSNADLHFTLDAENLILSFGSYMLLAIGLLYHVSFSVFFLRAIKSDKRYKMEGK